jgi:wobble nucleotide-excising tRNase
MASEESEGDVSTTTSIGLRRRQKKEKKARGARQLQLLWQRPAEREQGEAQSTMRDLSLARDVRACVAPRASLERERESERERK